MIAYVRGILSYIGSDFVIIETAGLGYQIFIPMSTLQRLPAIGQELKLFTHHHVREDAIVLFGFLTPEEQAIFMHLISVSGIGPKGAITMLGALQPGRFVQAISLGDVNALMQIPGVGKKTAQRLVLELKDKLQAADAGTIQEEMKICSQTAGSVEDEAYEALLALGYTAQEAGRVLAEVRRDLPEDASSDMLVRQALRAMMTRGVK